MQARFQNNCLKKEMPEDTLSHLSRRLKGHPLHVRHKQNWGRGFIFLLLQAVVLSGSGAGKPHRVESSSSKTVKSCATCDNSRLRDKHRKKKNVIAFYFIFVCELG